MSEHEVTQIFLTVCRSSSYPGHFYIERRENKYGKELQNGKREFLNDKGELGFKLGIADREKGHPDYLGCYYKSREEADETINKYFEVIEKSDDDY